MVMLMLMMLMKMTYLYSICHNLCVKHEFVFRKQLPIRTVEYFDPSSTHNLCLYLKIINRIKFHCCHHSNAHLFFFFLRLGYNYIYIYALSFLHPWKGVGGTRALAHLLHYTTTATTTRLHYTTLHYNYNYTSLHYNTLDHTALCHATVHNTTVHYNTQH